VSSCARTYSGQRPGPISGPTNRLSPVARVIWGSIEGAASSPGKIIGGAGSGPRIACRIRRLRDASLQARDVAVTDTRQGCRRPGERCGSQGLGGPRRVRTQPRGIAVRVDLMDLASTFGGPGMYLGDRAPMLREVKYKRHQRIHAAGLAGRHLVLIVQPSAFSYPRLRRAGTVFRTLRQALPYVAENRCRELRLFVDQRIWSSRGWYAQAVLGAGLCACRSFTHCLQQRAPKVRDLEPREAPVAIKLAGQAVASEHVHAGKHELGRQRYLRFNVGQEPAARVRCRHRLASLSAHVLVVWGYSCQDIQYPGLRILEVGQRIDKQSILVEAVRGHRIAQQRP
jgi:hypothetical protein